MAYRAVVDSGGEIVVENEGEQTHITLSSGGSGQKQSQSTGFTTGAWTKPPALFKAKGKSVLQIRTNRGEFYFQVNEGGIRALREAPTLNDPLPLKLSKTGEERAIKPLPPMKPMRPMAPMEPMKPMEMTMGSMRMSMGQPDAPASPEKSPSKGVTRFCTNCGREAGPEDKFCAACGHRLK
jgi:hypothetical protein